MSRFYGSLCIIRPKL